MKKRISQVNNREQKASAFCFFVEEEMEKRKMAHITIITNNSRVWNYYKEHYDVVFLNDDYKEVLCRTRDRIHKGGRLLTHPLSGSLKPGETPYKSIAISENQEHLDAQLDYQSLELIEQGLAVYEKFSKQRQSAGGCCYTERVLEDFREIDFTLLFSALR